MIIDQAFVDDFGGDIMLARLEAEEIFNNMKAGLETLLASQSFVTTFRLINFTDYIAPNNWNSSDESNWAANVRNYWASSTKTCIKKDATILLTGQEPAWHGYTHASTNLCDPDVPGGYSSGVVIVRNDGVSFKALGHELMHIFGLGHTDDDPSCTTCYDTDPDTPVPLMCSSGSGDWHFTDCDRPCLRKVFDASKCPCLQVIRPSFPSDYTCPSSSNVAFSISAENPSPVLNCKTDGDITTLTITLINNNTVADRNITAFINDDDDAFATFFPDSSSEFNCIKVFTSGIPRTEFRITNPVEPTCNNVTSFHLEPNEAKTVTLKVKYSGGITFGNTLSSFSIYIYTGSTPNTNNSFRIFPFVPKSGETTNIWDFSNPVIINGQLVIDTGVPVILGLNANGTANNTNNKLLFTTGSGLEINGANTLKLVHTQVEGCDNMWKGITVRQGGTLEMNTMTSVMDGQYAINVQRGGTVKATDCMFFNNNYSVRTDPGGSGLYNITLLGNQYGTNETGLKPSYSGQSPIPFENRGYAGVYLVNAGSIALQKSAAQSENKFFSLHHGIISQNTNLTVKNTKFENIEKIMGVPGLTAFDSPGKAIYAKNGSLVVTGSGILSDDPVNFTNCYTAIEGFQASLTVTQNKMRSVTNGVLSRVGINKNISVTFNDIDARDYGIGVYHAAALANGCLVHNNVVAMNGTYGGIGIATGGTGDFAQQNGLFQDNNITVTEGFAGINIGVSRNLAVRKNIINTRSSAFWGIGISGGDMNTINCNNVSGHGDKGIYGLMAGRSAFICNDVVSTGLGLHFDGVFLGKGTIPVAGNTMDNNPNAGLLMGGDAIIGEQIHRGNKWTGGVTLAHHLGGLALVLKSLFTVDANEDGNFLPSFIDPAGWFINSSNPALSYQCIPNTNCPSVAFSSDPVSDKEIARGELTGLANQAAQLWMAQRRLYEKLTEEVNPYTGDNDINTFLSQAQTNGLSGYGDLQKNLRLMFSLSINDIADLTSYESQIDQKMNQLAEIELDLNTFGISQTDSTNLTNQRNAILQALASITAQRESKLSSISSTRSNLATSLVTQNDALNGTAEYSLNEKTVNSIFLQTVALESNTFSEAQLSSLQSIAGQCALSGGEAVLRARDMLNLVDRTAYFYNDDVLCGAQPRTSNWSANSFGDAIKIFPNPANDEITIEYNVQNPNGTSLKFFNVYGQLIKEVSLPSGKGKLLTQTNSLDSGIYFYSINGFMVDRIVINH